jgi:type IV pilus assembly protein PilB
LGSRNARWEYVQERVGLKLLEADFISKETFEEAVKQQREHGGTLLSWVSKLGELSEDDLAQFLASLYSVKLVDLEETEIDTNLLDLIPADVAARFQVVPIKKSGYLLTIAMADPSNIFLIDDLKFITGCEIEPVVAHESAIESSLEKLYGSPDTLADIMHDMEADVDVVSGEDEEDDSDIDEASQAPVVKYVNHLIAEAISKGASDIHVEPYERCIRVRFRIDGALCEMAAPPYRMRAAVTSRLKIMSELDIAERRIPQDGRIKIKVGEKTVDIRVSTCPTIFGEKVVMRVLDRSNLTLDFEKAGFTGSGLENFLSAIKSPYGMVLVTGPTGSGKTTTLYTALSMINLPDVNIMTAEDPVEYNIEGINQVAIKEEIKLTFATTLRAFLRQDPNIIMVGEIRDLDTASIATKAALTGHLVLSTLHTNDAPSAVNRMIDMGVEPFLVAASTNLMMAQRLVRRVCTRCKQEIEYHKEIVAELGLTDEEVENTTFYKGQGCIHCNNTGYKGRTGVYEVLPVTPAVRTLILDRAPTSEIKRVAVEEGMMTLRRDGLNKLKAGITSAEEVLKETAPDR